MPADHVGDFGVEGFSRRDATAFQCYALREPVSTRERYEKQRGKITRDLAKFSDQNKRDALRKLFGDTIIRTWALVVPRFDSAKLVQHASDKAKEIRELELPYAAADFKVHIITDDHLEVEREKLRQQGLSHINLPPITVKRKAIGDWAKSHSEILNRMDRKLQKLPTAIDTQDLKKVRTQLLLHYLQGENLNTYLKQEYPYWYEQLSRCKQHREQFLATKSLLSREPLFKTIEAYIDEIKKKVRAIDADNAEILGYSTAVDWLLRCPLEFREATNA